MNYKYFIPTPQTPDEAKKLYHRLALENHPDRGGNVETMKEINAEYSQLLTNMERTAQRNRQEEAHKDGRKTAADYHDLDSVLDNLRKAIMLGLDLQNAKVELMGLWVWITFPEKPADSVLDVLRTTFIDGTRYRYAKNKNAWYYAGIPSMNRKPKSLDAIRATYGSRTFTRRDSRKEEETPASLPA